MKQQELIYKTMNNAGAISIAAGIVTTVIGVAAGVVMIVTGAKLLMRKRHVII